MVINSPSVIAQKGQGKARKAFKHTKNATYFLKSGVADTDTFVEVKQL